MKKMKTVFIGFRNYRIPIIVLIIAVMLLTGGYFLWYSSIQRQAQNDHNSYETMANSYRFHDNGDGTVSDNKTRLMWQKGEGYDVSLEQAKIAPEKMTVGGYHDWRMPNMMELLSIVDTTLNKPAFNSILGVNDSEYFWSCDSSVGFLDSQWVLNAGGGTGEKPITESHAIGGNKIYSLKCVRGELKIPSPRFLDNGDGTVTDNFLELVWQQKSLSEMSVEEAMNYVSQINEQQHLAWRLPTMPELAMLCNRSLRNPAIDTKYFPFILSNKYWTSSPLAFGKGKQWYVDLSSGMTTYDDPGVKHSVLLVRSK